jgi:hypothetical protein
LICFIGAFGGIGLKLAHWAVANGARYIILTTSRSISDLILNDAQVVGLKKCGASVQIFSCTGANIDELRLVFTSAVRPIKGIFHLSNKLDDGLISSLNPKRLNNVLQSKAIPCWNLHQLTATEFPVQIFCLFSSVAGCFGNKGQSNYGAANAFLDSIAEERVRMGLPGLSLSLPMIDGAGKFLFLKKVTP